MVLQSNDTVCGRGNYSVLSIAVLCHPISLSMLSNFIK